ncbi:thioesterase family protein [Amycolatopsis sp. NPDC059657]|uniref:thioesterase family protein n=1 Tax=Amycolatopsis sp. NPDC059657 TaxID=3346899 RepID=UPI00366D2F67
MTEAFYQPLGDDRFQPALHTAGPWNPDAQHFGPPSALLVRALEGVEGGHGKQLTRVTVEILGPAPLTELTVRAGLDRPGRSVELLSAELRDGGRTVARASAWRISTSDTAGIATDPMPSLAAPEDAPPANWPAGWGGGYLESMEWRAVRGAPDEAGPAAVWARQRVPLVAGEEPSPLQRLFVVADSGNGVSNFLDPRQWWFINTELTVHLSREPEGEWIGIYARTVVGPRGTGFASSTLHDRSGHVGAGQQALLVRSRAG